MRTLLRDLARQRLRTGLTISGISLGILTLVVLGALGEHFRGVIEEARASVQGRLWLFTKTNQDGFNPGIRPERVEAVRARDDVALVAPTLQLWFDGFDLQDDPLAFMVPKPLVEGVPAAHAATLRDRLELLEGRWLREGDDRHAVLAGWLAKRRGLSVGDEVTIRHKGYEVVGIVNAPDIPAIPAGIVPYERLNEDLQRPLVERAEAFLEPLTAFAPPGVSVSGLAERFVAQQESLFRVYEVVPVDRSVAGTRALSEALRAEAEEVAVVDPEALGARMEQALGLILAITSLVTVISTVVGGLLIVNTMAMAVVERRGEIAVKAALGATPGQVAWEFLVEAGLLGLSGVVIGSGLAWVAIAVAEPLVLAQVPAGEELFRVTPRLLLATTTYGVGMGVLAGGLPALRAARIDPAQTLREL